MQVFVVAVASKETRRWTYRKTFVLQTSLGTLVSLDLVTFDRLHKPNGSFLSLLDVFV